MSMPASAAMTSVLMRAPPNRGWSSVKSRSLDFGEGGLRLGRVAVRSRAADAKHEGAHCGGQNCEERADEEGQVVAAGERRFAL